MEVDIKDKTSTWGAVTVSELTEVCVPFHSFLKQSKIFGVFLL